jgi:DNA-binding transcriptional ArsR family regulator
LAATRALHPDRDHHGRLTTWFPSRVTTTEATTPPATPRGATTMIRDPAVMRALAHPARLALLDHLSQHQEGATATQCAAVVGLSPSATSYHLRALAKVGLIQEAPGRGDGRERVWRATHENFEVSNDPGAGAEEIAAESALVETFMARQNEKVRQFLAVARIGPREWYDVAIVGDRTLMLTAPELKNLMAQIDELVEPLKKRNRREPPRDARAVSFQLRAVPTDPAP